MKKPMIKALACSLAFTMALSTPVAVSAEGIVSVYSETQDKNTNTTTSSNSNSNTNTTVLNFIEDNYSKVIGLTVSPEVATVEVGNEITLEATVLVDVDAKPGTEAFRPMALNEMDDEMLIVFEGEQMTIADLKDKVHWYVDKGADEKALVSLNKNGSTVSVKGLEAGVATVSVKLGDVYKASATVKVKQYATTLEFKADAPTVGYVKHNCMNLYDFVKYNGNDDIAFSVYAPDRKGVLKATKNITIASDGQMTFKKAGTYTIKAVTERGIKASHVITIEAGVKATSVTSADKKIPLEIIGNEGVEANPFKEVSVVLAPENTTDHVLWSSNKTNIATVVGNGTSATIIAQNPGKAKITAKATNGKKYVFDVTVTAPLKEIKGIKLVNKTNIYQGQSVELEVIKVPQNATDKIKLTTSDKSVATVNNKGILKASAKKDGKVTIKAECTTKNTTVTPFAQEFVVQKTTLEDITLGENKKTIALYRGKSYVFTAGLKGTDVNEEMVTWSGNKDKVATVDQLFGSTEASSSAIAKAYEKGKAKITVSGLTKDGKKKSQTATVEVKLPVTSIELNKTAVTVNPKTKAQTVTLKVSKQLPKTAKKETITWSIVEDETTVAGATVDSKKGKVTIPATAKLGEVIVVKATAASGASNKATITVCNKTKNVTFVNKADNKKQVTAEVGAKLVIGENVVITVNPSDSKADTNYNEKYTITANNKNVRVEGNTIYVLKAGTSKVTAMTASGKKAVLTIKAN